jgi:hypothetical protein
MQSFTIGLSTFSIRIAGTLPCPQVRIVSAWILTSLDEEATILVGYPAAVGDIVEAAPEDDIEMVRRPPFLTLRVYSRGREQLK